MTIIAANQDLPLPPKGTTRLTVRRASGSTPVDLLCFALGASGRVPSDDWLIFFNQTHSPQNAIVLDLSQTDRLCLDLQPQQLPMVVMRCLIVVVPEGDQGFHGVRDLSVDIQPPGQPTHRYPLSLPSRGKALQILELGRTPSGWRLRSLDQSLDMGLEPLVVRYGVEVSDAPSSPSSPSPPSPPSPPPIRPAPSHSAAPSPPSRPPRRRRRWPGVLLLLIIAGGAAGYFLPMDQLPGTSTLVARLRGWLPVLGPPPLVEEPPTIANVEDCSLTAETIMARYHRLGNNYLRIDEIINGADTRRASLSRQLRESDTLCDADFQDANRSQVSTLDSLPVTGWFTETELLSRCIGDLNDQVQTELERSTAVAVTRRLTQQADNYRRVESDLTNIARELAYFRNKQERLLDAFQTHLAICQQLE